MKECRKRKYNLLKASLPQKIANFFRDYMNIRGHRASLNVNDEKSIIELRVERPGDDVFGRAEEYQRAVRGRVSDVGATKRILQDLRGWKFFGFKTFEMYMQLICDLSISKKHRKI